MAYQKQLWSDDPNDNTPISAARLNHMEDGIANIDTELEVADGSITTAKLANSAVTSAKLGNSAVSNAKIANLAVDTAKLGSSSVTTAKINDLSVTAAKIGSNAVTNEKIATGAVTAAKIASNSITGSELASSSVSATHINSSAVTNPKLINGAVSTAKLQDASVTGAKIANGAVTAAKLSTAPVASGRYSGDGSWNRQINLPFTPNYVSVKPHQMYARYEAYGSNDTSAVVIMKLDRESGSQSNPAPVEIYRETGTRGTTHFGYMIRLQAGNSFRVNGEGHEPSINQSGITYFWYAIGDM